MSRPNPDVDLGALARPAASARARPPRRRWLVRAVPLALLLGFLAVLASSLSDWLVGATPVEVVRPIPYEGGSAASAGSAGAPGAVVVQAAGWVEPDPFPIRVSALAQGIVRAVLVQESDTVRAGDPVATLVDEDARLALRDAEAQLLGAEAELALARAELAAARESFDAGLAVRERLAVARAELDGRRAEAEHRAQAEVEARARLAAGEAELVVQRYLAQEGAAGPRAIELAEAALAETKAEVAILAADAALARAQALGAEAVLERAQRESELRTEERLRSASAGAELERAEARSEQAAVARDVAQLALERTTVRAPQDGVVLERLVAPGAELTAENAAVATLYDPRALRVRVDVPQGELAKLGVGQSARIESDARRRQPYTGEVIRLVRRADVNKVTLQAHVRVDDADELLRPEMLVQVRFLARADGDGASSAASGAASADAVRIPAELVVGGVVWVLDATGRRAEQRAVELGAEEGGLATVLRGLNLSDKVIATGLGELEPGERVEATPRAAQEGR